MSTNRVVILREFLETKLLSLNLSVYYENAPSSAEYPFVVYELGDSIDDGLIERFPLLLDGWGKGADSTALENMMSLIDNSLQRLRGGDEELFFIFYRTGRRPIRDPDKRLKRRQLEFEIKVMGGNR